LFTVRHAGSFGTGALLQVSRRTVCNDLKNLKSNDKAMAIMRIAEVLTEAVAPKMSR